VGPAYKTVCKKMYIPSGSLRERLEKIGASLHAVGPLEKRFLWTSPQKHCPFLLLLLILFNINSLLLNIFVIP
jgi:hypothetical protein